MNGIYKKTEITEADIEEMSRLAEDVMHQMYMNYEDYDADGNDIFTKYYRAGDDFEKDIQPLIRAEHEARLADSNNRLLYDLFRRGDDIGDVRYYTLEDVKPWIEPIIQIALQLFRKGTNSNGDTNFVVAESVSDDYLTAAFAREVRNMMMIFAAQKMQEENTPRYLLLLEASSCRDMDEWRGIYYDDESLKKAYEELTVELEEKKTKDGYYRSLNVGIWEFKPIGEYDTEGVRKEKKQKIRPVKPEELQCFKSTKGCGIC